LTSPPPAAGAPYAGAGIIAGGASKSNKFISAAGGYSIGIIAFGFSSLSLSLSFLFLSIP